MHTDNKLETRSREMPNTHTHIILISFRQVSTNVCCSISKHTLIHTETHTHDGNRALIINEKLYQHLKIYANILWFYVILA